MAEETSQRLSDIHLEVDGFTAQDIVESRKARNELIMDAANNGNWFAIQAEWLSAQARLMGYNDVYDEELDDLDLE